MASIVPKAEDGERGLRRLGSEGYGAWDPFRLVSDLLRWDPVRDTAMGGLPSAFVPSFDVRETPDGYVFVADLPGFREQDVDVSVTQSMLTVTGRREREQTKEDERSYCAERSFGQFRRSFSLPDVLDPDSAKAELKDGVLRIALGKRPEVQPRRVALSSNRRRDAKA